MNDAAKATGSGSVSVSCIGGGSRRGNGRRSGRNCLDYSDHDDYDVLNDSDQDYDVLNDSDDDYFDVVNDDLDVHDDWLVELPAIGVVDDR